jgi:hypothetical protein
MHAHPGALAILAGRSGISLPRQGRQSFAANNVSTRLMASGHVPHAQKELFQEITVWGWNLWFDLSNKLLVLSVPPLVDPATNIAIWASRCDAAEKPY